MKWIAERLASPRVIWAAAGLGILLTLPSLRAGRGLDDEFHRLLLVGVPHPERLDALQREVLDQRADPWDLFAFSVRNPEKTRRLIDLGNLPWWTPPDLQAGFLRPVTALTHWIDYRLWPARVWLMHLQSVFWYGLLCLVAARFYRALGGAGWPAGLAAILFAMDDAHGTPAGWLANRNALLAGVFGVLCLLAHHRWRQSGSRAAAWLAPAWLVLSLLSAELGVSTVAVLLAYALFVDRTPRASRWVSLLPAVLTVGGWRLAWTGMGYGVDGLGGYIDPLASPVRFLGAGLRRAPVLLNAQIGFPPSEADLFFSSFGSSAVLVVAVVGILLATLLLAPVVRRDGQARFFAAAMLLALVPACATFPGDRLLVFVGLAAMGLLSRFAVRVAGAPGRVDRARLSWPLRIGAGALLLVHGLVAPILLMGRSGYPLGSPTLVRQLAVRSATDAAVEEQVLVVLNSPSFIHTAYSLFERTLEGRPSPRRFRVLGPSISGITITRVDEQTLTITPDHAYLSWPLDRLYRSADRPFLAGDEVELEGLSIRVQSVDGHGRPTRVEFRFPVPLEHESLRWLEWVGGEFVAFEPPAVGEVLARPLLRPQF